MCSWRLPHIMPDRERLIATRASLHFQRRGVICGGSQRSFSATTVTNTGVLTKPHGHFLGDSQLTPHSKACSPKVIDNWRTRMLLEPCTIRGSFGWQPRVDTVVNCEPTHRRQRCQKHEFPQSHNSLSNPYVRSATLSRVDVAMTNHRRRCVALHVYSLPRPDTTSCRMSVSLLNS
jgi:hypothetical protein